MLLTCAPLAAGMVSPFKIAREAALDKTAGATKFSGEGRAELVVTSVFGSCLSIFCGHVPCCSGSLRPWRKNERTCSL